MGVSEVTRLIVAGGYATAALLFAVMLYRATYRTVGTLHTVGAFIVAALWAGWYLALVIFDLPFDPWGTFNRVLHLPTIALFLVIAWTRLHQGEPE